MEIYSKKQPFFKINLKKDFFKNKKFLSITSFAAAFSTIILLLTNTPITQSISWRIFRVIGSSIGGGPGEFLRGSAEFNSSLLTSILNWSGSLRFKNPKIILDIPLENFLQLQNLKKKALAQGVNLDKDDWFKSSLRTSYSSNQIPVKLRLKGDWTDHLKYGRWSFRIKTKKENYFKGMRSFSIQPAETRSYIYESMFQSFLGYAKLPYLRYTFADLIINGGDKGVYAIEESFGKELIENSGYRESVILRFSENNFFKAALRDMQLLKLEGKYNSKNLFDKRNLSSLKSFNHKKISENETLSRLYSKAINNYELFASGEKEAKEVFDYRSFAKFYAVADLFQTWHPRRWHNLRYYFNPITGKFLPVGFDASKSYLNSNLLPSFANDNSENRVNNLYLFNDPLFAKEYVQAVNTLSSEKYLNNFFSFYEKKFERQLQTLHSSFPFVQSIEGRIRLAANILSESIEPPPDPFQIKKFQDSANSTTNLKLLFSSNHKLPIRIISVDYNSETWLPIEGSEYLSKGNFADKGRSYKEIVFSKNKNIIGKKPLNSKKTNTYTVSYKTIGSNNIMTKDFEIILTESTNLQDKFQINNFKKVSNPNIKYFNLNKDTLSFREDNITVKEDIIIPKGLKLEIKNGSKVNFLDGASLISSSPININGTPSQPVTFIGSPTSSILLFSTNNESKISYAKFEGFGEMSNNNSEVTGAITFYESPVEINNTFFIGNKSEDALNIFRSNFKLKDTVFENSQSDALDIDFSEGSIENVTFTNIGNDAMDFSGSKVNINFAKVYSAADKVLSAGERSNIKAKNITLIKSSVGITSKDSSSVFASNVLFRNIDVCLTAFNKKPFFKGGAIKIDSIKGLCEVPYLIEKGSSLHIGNKLIEHNSNDVESMMYGNQYGRATRK